MSDILKSCFMDEQPNFTREVHLNDVLIGTIRALTDEDNDIIRRKSGMSSTINEDGKLVMNVYPEAIKNAKILLSLGGTISGRSFKYGIEGWTLKDKTGKIAEINEQTVNKLMPVLKDKFMEEINKLEKDWQENKEAILKNLNSL